MRKRKIMMIKYSNRGWKAIPLNGLEFIQQASPIILNATLKDRSFCLRPLICYDFQPLQRSVKTVFKLYNYNKSTLKGKRRKNDFECAQPETIESGGLQSSLGVQRICLAQPRLSLVTSDLGNRDLKIPWTRR